MIATGGGLWIAKAHPRLRRRGGSELSSEVNERVETDLLLFLVLYSDR